MEYKSFDFKVSNVEELTNGEWIVEGYASTWTTDNGNDRLVRGAFLDSYRERFVDQKAKNGKSKIKILWQHDPADIIGQLLEAREDEHGLFIRVQLIKHPLFVNAEKAYILSKLGELDSFSIGYKVLKSRKVSEDGAEIKELIKVKWYEVSFVTFPMNELAEFTSVKEEDEYEEMNEQILEAINSLKEDLSLVLKSLVEKPEPVVEEVKTEEAQIQIGENQLAPELVEKKNDESLTIDLKLDVEDFKAVLEVFRNEILAEVKALLPSGVEIKAEEEKANLCANCKKPMKEDIIETIDPTCDESMKSDIKEFEEKTPYELPEVVEAGTELKNNSNPENSEEDFLDYLLTKEFKF